MQTVLFRIFPQVTMSISYNSNHYTMYILVCVCLNVYIYIYIYIYFFFFFFTDADYADDIAILANTPDQAETLLHSLERAAASIGLHVNAHKTEYMCYNQTGDISTLEGTPLKLVDKFTYLGSSVESTEKDIETRLTKAWTAINRLSTIWKSDLTDKNETQFLPGSGHIDTAIWMHYMDANKTAGEETRWQLHKNAACNPQQVLAATPHKTPTVRPPAPYHEIYSS